MCDCVSLHVCVLGGGGGVKYMFSSFQLYFGLLGRNLPNMALKLQLFHLL